MSPFSLLVCHNIFEILESGVEAESRMWELEKTVVSNGNYFVLCLTSYWSSQSIRDSNIPISLLW